MEDIDGGLHSAVDGQSLGERWNRKATDRRQWKTLMEGYILQWMDKALTKTKLRVKAPVSPDHQKAQREKRGSNPGAAITEADDRQVTTVFTDQPPFHHTIGTRQTEYHEALLS